jgi:hypothetical protein
MQSKLHKLFDGTTPNDGKNGGLKTYSVLSVPHTLRAGLKKQKLCNIKKK